MCTPSVQCRTLFIVEDLNFLLEFSPLEVTPQSTTSGLMQDHELLLCTAGAQKNALFLPIVIFSNTTAIHWFFCSRRPKCDLFFFFFFSLCKDKERWQKYTALDGLHIWVLSPGHTARNTTSPVFLCFFSLLLTGGMQVVSLQTRRDFTERERERLSVCEGKHVSPSFHTPTQPPSPPALQHPSVWVSDKRW